MHHFRVLIVAVLVPLVITLFLYFSGFLSTEYEMSAGTIGVPTRTFLFEDKTYFEEFCNELHSDAWQDKIIAKINAKTQPFVWEPNDLIISITRRPEVDEENRYYVNVTCRLTMLVHKVNFNLFDYTNVYSSSIYNDKALMAISVELEQTYRKYADIQPEVDASPQRNGG